MRKNYIVMQEDKNDCGASCLLSIIRFYGGDASKERIVEQLKTTKDGTNFYSLKNAAYKYGLTAKAFVVEDIEKIKKINSPFIAQVKKEAGMHFVVVYHIEDNKVTLMDPTIGKVKMDLFEFSSMWTGYIMIFEKVFNTPLYIRNKSLNNIIISSLFKNKSIIVSLIILSIIFTILSVVSSMYAQIIFDKVIDTNVTNIILVSGVFSVLYIIKNITNYIRNYIIIYFNQKLDISIIEDSFKRVILLPYYYYKNKNTGEVLSRINDLVNIKNFITKVIVTCFLDIFTFIISLIIIYMINKNIIFISLVICFIYVVILFIFNPFIKSITKYVQEGNARVNSNIIECISSFETVKGLHIEDNILRKFSNVYSNYLNRVYNSEKISNNMLFMREIIMDLGILFINYLSIRYIKDSIITRGQYLTIMLLSSYLIYPFRNIISMIPEYHLVKGSIHRFNNLLEVEIDKYEDKRLVVNGNIRVNNLTYSYNNKNNILDSISFDIKDKEKVLVLGPSGCGKSTIMKILYKYYKVDRDMIYIDNEDINDYNLSDIRDNFTYISQNEMLYTDTIQNNILLGRNIDYKLFLSICKIFYIDDIIKDNVMGYDYMLLENGVNISGGERERIILGRSFLKDSKVVIIDEGLNQIDINLERKILKNMFYYFYDKTIIIISHRKENMDLYDKVISFNGKNAEVLERSDTNYE